MTAPSGSRLLLVLLCSLGLPTACRSGEESREGRKSADAPAPAAAVDASAKDDAKPPPTATSTATPNQPTSEPATPAPCGARVASLSFEAPPTAEEWKDAGSSLAVEIAADEAELERVPKIAPPPHDRAKWESLRAGKRYELQHDASGRATQARVTVELEHDEGSYVEHYQYLYDCGREHQTITASSRTLATALDERDLETLAKRLSPQVYIGGADVAGDVTNGDTLYAEQVRAVLEAYPQATKAAAELLREGCGVDATHEGYICPRQLGRDEMLEGLSYVSLEPRHRTIDAFVLSALDGVPQWRIDAVARPNPTDYDGYPALAGLVHQWVSTQSPSEGLPTVFAKAGPDVTVHRHDANCSGRKCTRTKRERLADLQLWFQSLEEQPGWDVGELVGCEEDCCSFEDYGAAAAAEGGMVPHELVEVRRVCFTPYGDEHAGTIRELELVLH